MRKNQYASRVRNKIVSSSLKLEKLVTLLLVDLLDIDANTSATLGNKSSSLSFKSKVELLIDIGVLEQKPKNKFLKLMEIRNQFAHNISVNSFTSCFEQIDGIVPFLKKNYPNAKGDKQSTESLFEKLFEELLSELFSCILIANKAVKDKKHNHLSNLYKIDAFDILLFSVENMARVYQRTSENDSIAHKLAERMLQFVDHAKNGLYDAVVERARSDSGNSAELDQFFPS